MSDHQKKPNQVKQQLLGQINAQRDAIEALSDEELESVAGGIKFVNHNTGGGVVMPSNTINTGVVVRGGSRLGLSIGPEQSVRK